MEGFPEEPKDSGLPNPGAPENITPEYATRVLGFMEFIGNLDREHLGFLVGHMAVRDVDSAIEAYGALLATDLPLEGL